MATDVKHTQHSTGMTTPTYLRGASLLKAGAIGGLLAGAIFAVMEMFMAAVMGMGLLGPWGAFGSIVLGKSAMGGMTFGIFIVGFVVHFALSALFGVVWGALSRILPLSVRASFGAHGAAAAIFGVGLYLVNFQVLARLFYPWFLNMNQFGQLMLHALAFGLPLGLLMVWQIRKPALLGRHASA
jgi:hypothetical protein